MIAASQPRPRLKGFYLSGTVLYRLAVDMRGYYWVKQAAVRPGTANGYAVFTGDHEHIGGANSPAECRVVIVRHFVEVLRGSNT